MEYYSLNHKSAIVNFEEATLNGQAPDKGLYFPTEIPILSASFLQNLKYLTKQEIGFEVMQPYVGKSIPQNVLQDIVEQTIFFEFPLIKINESIQSLELFHGPTLAFKDVGARFMSRCLGYFNRNSNKHCTVLVATSGDTGGAVADGFLGVDGVEVIILYPKGKVSIVQELQLTTLGKNITAIEVEGSFDDCQAIVKQAFMDSDIQAKKKLTSANSINVARWLPQQLYYYYAYQQWDYETPPIVSVPSGNFGNLCAGILAHCSGLPTDHFIAACNVNDVVPNYFDTQQYNPKPTVATISNAMDVGNPSNFIRILELFKNDFNSLSSKITSYSITDDMTIKTMQKVYQESNYILDPHGAVAYSALEKYLIENSTKKGYILETAHPLKFPVVVEDVIEKKIEIPKNIEHLFGSIKKSISIDASYYSFKDWILS